jgi:tetratricopeptide (TPR) repeat protein
VRTFVGRGEEQAMLTSVISAAADADMCETVVISAIDGMGGVGKSALAVHVAHRLSGLFPDGQLFVDFRSHTAGLNALTSEEALGQLLGALGVPPGRIPPSLAERAALYRSTLAGTRTLVLIDNATTSAQVRPLLPAGRGCLALVTSRRQLIGLDDAHFLSLDVLPLDDAVALLLRVAGPGRLDAQDHPSLAALAELCGRLPLALRVAAAHLRHRRTLTAGEYVDQLWGAADRLERLRDEDRNLTAVFDSSFVDLSPDEQLCFRLLGLVPGADFDAYAVANLLGGDYRSAERLLESMLTQNLLVQRTPGRYEFHDLVRGYARQLIDPSAPEIVASWERLLDFYECCAGTGEILLDPLGHPRRRTRPHESLTSLTPELAHRTAGLAWFRAELDNILAAVADARQRGRHDRVVDLSAACQFLLVSEGRWAAAASLHVDAVAAARALGQPRLLFERLVALARAQESLGEFDAAYDTLAQAVAESRFIQALSLEASALSQYDRVRQSNGDLKVATELYDRVLEIRREQNDTGGEAITLSYQGRLKLATGEVALSQRLQQRSLALHAQSGNRIGEAIVSWDLADVERHLGNLATATQLLHRSLEITRELDIRSNEGFVLWLLGTVRLEAGDLAEARTLFDQAASLFEETGEAMGTFIVWERARVSLAEGDPATAVGLLHRALAEFRSARHREGLAHTLCELGRARSELGAPTTAALRLDGALALFREIGNAQGGGRGAQRQGRVRGTPRQCGRRPGAPP